MNAITGPLALPSVPSTALSPRRHDLDWLRIIAFGLLILYHMGMFFVTWDWHVKRSEEHTSELQSLMRISYAVFCLKKKKKKTKLTHKPTYTIHNYKMNQSQSHKTQAQTSIMHYIY